MMNFQYKIIDIMKYMIIDLDLSNYALKAHP